MKKPDVKRAKTQVAKLRKLAFHKKSPLTDMKEEEVIKLIRKTREELWDKKLASRS